jgi:hypothetical protein
MRSLCVDLTLFLGLGYMYVGVGGVCLGFRAPYALGGDDKI